MIDGNVNNPMELRLAGIHVLAELIGSVGVVRFAQQIENGCGNYTKEKYDEPEPSMDEMEREIQWYI